MTLLFALPHRCPLGTCPSRQLNWTAFCPQVVYFTQFLFRLLLICLASLCDSFGSFQDPAAGEPLTGSYVALYPRFRRQSNRMQGTRPPPLPRTIPVCGMSFRVAGWQWQARLVASGILGLATAQQEKPRQRPAGGGCPHENRTNLGHYTGYKSILVDKETWILSDAARCGEDTSQPETSASQPLLVRVLDSSDLQLRK